MLRDTSLPLPQFRNELGQFKIAVNVLIQHGITSLERRTRETTNNREKLNMEDKIEEIKRIETEMPKLTSSLTLEARL